MPTLNLTKEEVLVLHAFMQRLADDETMSDHETLRDIEDKTFNLYVDVKEK